MPVTNVARRRLAAVAVFALGSIGSDCNHKPPTGPDPRPQIAITSPSGAFDVTAEGFSVWFEVNGTASGVGTEFSVCVLVHSGVEWHVQQASSRREGSWNLPRAWIGDESAQIRVGTQIRLVAVATRRPCVQDQKTLEYSRTLETDVVSPEVAFVVRTVR